MILIGLAVFAFCKLKSRTKVYKRNLANAEAEAMMPGDGQQPLPSSLNLTHNEENSVLETSSIIEERPSQ